VHVELLHTLGNLTLTGSNSELSNNPFARKQELYANSHLELNRELPELPAWGRDQILARAEQLATRIINIWPAPLRGYSQPADGFDWSTINAAVAAVPGGRWTSYGDLAQLGGTAPVPVGQHLASGPVLTNAYRVLGADGVPRPNFRWPDENDEREVIDVLRSEGVSFDTNGVADPQQRVRAEELATLLEPIDADADEGDGAPEADADEPYRARLAF
jgi:alkylated DNA nucleotide flippase Atl1